MVPDSLRCRTDRRMFFFRFFQCPSVFYSSCNKKPPIDIDRGILFDCSILRSGNVGHFFVLLFQLVAALVF